MRSLLLRISKEANITVEAIRKSTIGLKAPSDGWRIIIIPINPDKVANQWYKFTPSFRNIFAKGSTKNGVVKLIVVMSAKGRAVTPTHHAPIASVRRNARKNWRRGQRVTKAIFPRESMNGKRRKAPKRNRKKEISKPDKRLPRYLTRISLKVLMVHAIIIQKIPWTKLKFIHVCFSVIRAIGA